MSNRKSKAGKYGYTAAVLGLPPDTRHGRGSSSERVTAKYVGGVANKISGSFKDIEGAILKEVII